MEERAKQYGVSLMPSIVDELDATRGSVPRSRMIQNCIRLVMNDPELMHAAIMYQGEQMTITPEALVGAVVIEVDCDGEHIHHIVLERPSGVLVELVANRDIEVDGVPWMEVM